MKVAVLAFRGDKAATDRWSSTMKYLSSNVEGYDFLAIPMDLQQLDQAVINGSVDFAITNSGQFVRMGTKHGMSWLATLTSRRHEGRIHVIGSALAVRADSKFKTLNDLRGESLGAVSPLAFGGFQVYWGEMAKADLHPSGFFSEIRFSQFPVDALVYWVRDQQVSAAVLPACLLETMAAEGLIRLSDYRVIDIKAFENFSCQASTSLYPNWSFSNLKSTPPEVTEQVVKALLAMTADNISAIDSGSTGWTAPVSSYDIHQLFQLLDIHPWKVSFTLEFKNWLLKYWQWSLLLLLFMIAGFGHHLWVQFLVQKRTREIQLINARFLDQQNQLEHAQRISILGELSSEIAHELNQPLAAINSFAEGGVIRLAGKSVNGVLDSESVVMLLNRISKEAHRGSEIVQRIRGFARRQPESRTETNIIDLCKETLHILEYEIKKQEIVPKIIFLEKQIIALVDPIEIQQLLINLIRNSLDALENIEQQKSLVITIAEDDKMVYLDIKDNGIGITKEQRLKLFTAFNSTKKDGLGLGLSICKRIVESHGGNIIVSGSIGEGTEIKCSILKK